MSVQKITLFPSRDIPFNKLVLTQTNVRQNKLGISVEDLAADIAERGLLQSLSVRPLVEEDGAETGMYEVPAGGRRYRALELLIKQKRLTKTTPVPCVVKPADSATSAKEDSLAENTFRVALHPLDEFRAFRDLVEDGVGIETIAARFRTTPKIVQQRLKLASVSPKLLDAFGINEMTLEQLMAFTVSDDQTRQEQVWHEVTQGPYNDDPSAIRRLLTESMIPTYDQRVLYVGLDNYVSAGGHVVRDLFDEEDDGYLEDAALVDRLFTEKVKGDSEAIAAEGWKWIKVALTFPFGHDRGMRRIAGEQIPLSDDEHAKREALRAEMEQIEEQNTQLDELPDEVYARLEEIEHALEAFEARPLRYTSADLNRAGVFVSLRDDGTLKIERGYVKLEDEQAASSSEGPVEGDAEEGEDGETSVPAPMRATITIAGADDEEEGLDDGIKPLADRLVSELTAHRTLALQEALGDHPEVALTAFLHAACLDLFFHNSYGSCVQTYVRRVYPPIQATDLKESACAEAINNREAHWKDELPHSEELLWDYLDRLPMNRRLQLLAYCVSLGVNALHEKTGNPNSSGPSSGVIQRRLAHADVLAGAVGLDMVEAGWRPTVENYLGRVPKARILEAVREAKGDPSVQLIDHLKKGEMAKEAERVLDGTGWRPEPLRGPGAVSAEATADEEALPEFLADAGPAIAAE